MRPNNPFLITGYHSPEYFCDRKAECTKILDALHNGRNITLIAPRRMGKTGLIKNLFHQIREQDSAAVTIYLDIFSTQSLADLVQLMASSILGELDTTMQAIMSRVARFIRSCRPTVSVDDKSGSPTFSIDVLPQSEAATLKEIFEYLGSSERQCYIAIDEFQQVAEYPERGIEALLRSYIQFLPSVHFIFSGSKQHVMQEMFLSAKRPFYQSTQILAIEQIEVKEYHDFAAAHFAQQGRELSRELFEAVYDRFDGHTWYIQSILNRLYSYAESPDAALADRAIHEIIDESVYAYETLLSAYSTNNVALLKAVAKEGMVVGITSNRFILKYRLKAASSVATSLTKLLDKELIYKSKEGYILYDRFLSIWLSEMPY